MSRLPRFQQEGAPGFQPVTIPTTGARSLTELGQRVQAVGEKSLLTAQIKRATQAGEEAGVQPGKLQLPSGTGLAQRAFNQAALQTNKALIGTDVILKTAQMKQNAVEQNTDAGAQLEQFNARSQQYINQLMPNIPDENKAYVSNLIAHQVGTAQLGLHQNLIKQQHIKATAQFMLTQDTFTQEMNSKINGTNFNASPEDVQAQLDALGTWNQQNQNHIQLAEEGGIVKPKEANTMMLKNNSDLITNFTIAQYQSALQAGKGNDFLKKVDNNKVNQLHKLSPLDRQNLLSKLKTVRTNFQQAQGVSKGLLNQEKKQEIKAVQAGSIPNVALQSKVASFEGEGASDLFKNQVNNASFVGHKAQEITESRILDQEGMLNELKPKPNDPDAGQRFQNFNAIKSIVTNNNHLIEQKPVEFFNQNPQIRQFYNQKAAEADSGVKFDELRSTGFRPLSTNPREANLVAQVFRGRPQDQLKYYSVPESKALVGQIRSVGGTERVQKINDIANSLGKFAPIGFRNLIKDGKLPVGDQFLVGQDPNDPQLADIIQGSETSIPVLEKAIDSTRLSAFKKIDPLTFGPIFGRSNFDQYIQSLQTASTSTTGPYIANAVTHVKAVALSMMASDNSLTAAEAIKKAGDTIGDRFNYTTINGAHIRIPKRFSPDVSVEYAKFREKELSKLKYIIPQRFKNEVEGQQRFFESTVKPGHWATTADHLGLQWIDKTGVPVRQKNGQPIRINFTDAVHWTPPPRQDPNLPPPVSGEF